jgi:hypothetical protein
VTYCRTKVGERLISSGGGAVLAVPTTLLARSLTSRAVCDIGFAALFCCTTYLATSIHDLIPIAKSLNNLSLVSQTPGHSFHSLLHVSMEGSSSTNQAPPKEPSSHRQTIVLHVLSPSVEVPNKITFPVLPIAMTIGELKYEICDKVASRPRPERQRLIYRGKALVQENLTLREVFSQDTVRLILRTSTLQANVQT